MFQSSLLIAKDLFIWPKQSFCADTIGNCQSLLTWCISMHIITNLWKLELNWSSKLRRDNNERIIHPCHTKLCAFRWLISRPQILNLRSQNQIRGNYFFLENCVTSEGAVSHNVLYHQTLFPITRHQVRFYNDYFE